MSAPVIRLQQAAAVFRLELGKALGPRRNLWVYLLALAPLALIALYSSMVRHNAAERAAWVAQERPGLTSAAFADLPMGLSAAQLEQRLGRPVHQNSFTLRRGDRAVARYQRLDYATPDARFTIVLQEDKLVRVDRRNAPSFADSSRVFASLFQFFTLRLVIFFGCLGLFLRLFRGELLDRSLHYYFLAPVRREVVLAGKFAAGFTAAGVVFCGSVVLQIFFLGLHLDPLARAQFLGVGHGWAQIGAYVGVTALACLGYGAFFLVVGLFVRNPIVPAAALLIWEAINPFLPSMLKHISIIYYLSGLLPVHIASGPGTAPLLKLLATGGNALAPGWDILGILLVTAALLWLAALRVRRLEIDYAGD